MAMINKWTKSRFLHEKNLACAALKENNAHNCLIRIYNGRALNEKDIHPTPCFQFFPSGNSNNLDDCLILKCSKD